MKTTSRKRLLISSVAMLLVAMLALGTATFAWFTSSTTATAKGITLQTIKASKLEIASSDTSKWGTQVNYATNQTMIPASTANGETWFTANAASGTAYDRTGNFRTVATSDLKTYAFTEELNIRNAGDATVEDVKINFSIPEKGANKYMRVAVVPISAPGAEVEASTFLAKDATSGIASYIFDLDGVAYKAADSATTANTEILPQSDASKFSISVGDIAGKNGDTYTVKSYKVLVWFEGQDAQCFDNNAGNSIDDISFTVSGTTASQT